MTGDRFYVLRLISPRATFPADITPEEMTLMQAHVGYWSQFLKTGEAIVFGPVADPAGVWGLGVIRARDEEHMRELKENDPVIKAGAGFSYEVLPMMRAMVKA